jgi:hypothetical protein
MQQCEYNHPKKKEEDVLEIKVILLHLRDVGAFFQPQHFVEEFLHN